MITHVTETESRRGGKSLGFRRPCCSFVRSFLVRKRKRSRGFAPSSSAHVRWCEHGTRPFPSRICLIRAPQGRLKSLGFSRPCGTLPFRIFLPRTASWAKVTRPCGTQSLMFTKSDGKALKPCPFKGERPKDDAAIYLISRF